MGSCDNVGVTGELLLRIKAGMVGPNENAATQNLARTVYLRIIPEEEHDCRLHPRAKAWHS
ncbi:hypothetical protein AA0488_0771 [Kozakia baliensis NRIC 0488]|nr:hypothetical protein AA0488_0771 [Kozakia baliensis NRIC 0488]